MAVMGDARPHEGDELLPKNEWQYWLVQDNQIVVGHFIRGGYLGHTTVSLLDLPNDFITAADLEALGISLSRSEDGRAVFVAELTPRLAAH